jgi:hypothetical protein
MGRQGHRHRISSEGEHSFAGPEIDVVGRGPACPAYEDRQRKADLRPVSGLKVRLLAGCLAACQRKDSAGNRSIV